MAAEMAVHLSTCDGCLHCQTVLVLPLDRHVTQMYQLPLWQCATCSPKLCSGSHRKNLAVPPNPSAHGLVGRVHSALSPWCSTSCTRICAICSPFRIHRHPAESQTKPAANQQARHHYMIMQHSADVAETWCHVQGSTVPPKSRTVSTSCFGLRGLASVSRLSSSDARASEAERRCKFSSIANLAPSSNQ